MTSTKRLSAAAAQHHWRLRLASLGLLALLTLGCGISALGGGGGVTWVERRRHPSARPFSELATDVERAFANDERASVHRGETKVRVVLDRDAQLEVRDRGDRVLLVASVDTRGGPSRTVVLEQWMDIVAALPGVGPRTSGEQ